MILLDNNKEELKKIVLELGEPKFRAQQLNEFLLNDCNSSSLPKNLLEKLKENSYTVKAIEINREYKSDSVIKFLYKLNDDNLIEGILILNNYGNTLCLSTQVGCRMGCSFCASTLNGLVRNLSAGEILGQFVAVNRYLGGNLKNRKIANIVLMGSGEPLDNYDNVIKFLKLICDEGFSVSRRNISLSTCGLCDKIKELAVDFPGIVLTISLHASNDIERKKLMPIANKWSLNELMDSARYYFDLTKRRVIFEYILIKGENDSEANAKELKELINGLSYHVNIIPLNKVSERDLQCSTNCEKFLKWLEDMNMSATIRRSLGAEVEGACGQLRQKVLNEIEE